MKVWFGGSCSLEVESSVNCEKAEFQVVMLSLAVSARTGIRHREDSRVAYALADGVALALSDPRVPSERCRTDRSQARCRSLDSTVDLRALPAAQRPS